MASNIIYSGCLSPHVLRSEGLCRFGVVLSFMREESELRIDGLLYKRESKQTIRQLRTALVFEQSILIIDNLMVI